MSAELIYWDKVYPYLVRVAEESISTFPLSYATADPLAVGFQELAVVIFVTWLASVVTLNYSYVDRLWSIVPVVYVWSFSFRAYLDDGNQWNLRLLIMSILSTLWGARLTYNFARKGGYNLSEEDYRWAVLRAKMSPFAFQIFNVVFIAVYQHVLLFLQVSPVWIAYVFRFVPLNQLDIVATGLFVGSLTLETIADQQQWNFYQTKYALLANKKPLTGDYKLGFNRQGLFRYSRHPNFFAEQSNWIAFYVFSVSSSKEWLNPSIIGAVLLVLLFQGSTPFIEDITVSKYPEYKTYQQTVSRLIPWFPSKTKTHKD